MPTVGERTNRTWLPAVGAISGLALAFCAEYVGRFRGVDAFVLGGYVLGSVVFATTDRRSPADAVAGTAEPVADGARRRFASWPLVGGGVAAAVALNLVADVTVYHSLRAGRSTIVGPLLWVASVVVLLATALRARPLPT